MIGSFPARLLLYVFAVQILYFLSMVFGYLYPAFECYKFVEKHDLETDQLKFVCQYWILVALFTTCERVGDNILSWLPLYDEVKVALILYLWHPKTRGTIYIYGSFLRPYMANHEKEIDLYLVNLRKKIAIITTLLWQKALSYGQYRFFEVLQYASSQSAFAVSKEGK